MSGESEADYIFFNTVENIFQSRSKELDVLHEFYSFCDKNEKGHSFQDFDFNEWIDFKTTGVEEVYMDFVVGMTHSWSLFSQFERLRNNELSDRLYLYKSPGCRLDLTLMAPTQHSSERYHAFKKFYQECAQYSIEPVMLEGGFKLNLIAIRQYQVILRLNNEMEVDFLKGDFITKWWDYSKDLLELPPDIAMPTDPANPPDIRAQGQILGLSPHELSMIFRS